MRIDALVLGKTVSHYRIDSRLGEGGMGIVYSATDIQLHRRVALEAGDKARSESLAAEAQKFYARNQCPEPAWRASLLMALSRNGAAPAVEQAKEQLAALERQWSAEDFRKYRSRPDIRRLLGKLSQIKEN